VYIPLGGNRGGSVRTSVNLVAIFFLCGLWHGASWTFVVWGLYHGFFLSLERLRPLAPLGRVPTPVKVLYTVLVWMVGWVFFRATSLSQAAEMIRAMAFLGGVPGLGLEQARSFLDPQLSVVIPLGIVGSVAWYRPALAWFRGVRSHLRGGLARATDGLSGVAVVSFLLAVFVLCAIDLSASTHNPFIYFQF
jgi:alginate O-acetyltransferase complex protein AlgI